MRAYVEVHTDETGGMSSRAWTFDLGFWGTARTAETAVGALAMLQRSTGAPTIELEEQVDDFDPSFARDLEPATPGERATTMEILERARARTLELVENAEWWQLSRPSNEVPDIDPLGYASAGDLVRAFADKESRVYLPALGFEPREPLPDLVDELEASHEHVMRVVASLPDVLISVTPDGGEWTSVKLLRMLAWHERAHLGLLEALMRIW
ncbi:DinB family protein [Amnibacterium flavum]|nr:DinB family protein [Amnibacterium flavum]